MILTIPGHCYSLKTSRTIFRNKATGRMFPGKRKKLENYERQAVLFLRQAWGRRPPLAGTVLVSMVIYYSGPEPDAFGPAETVFDCLQKAEVVENDRQLVPSGTPAIARVHVCRAMERVEITLDCRAEFRK